MRGRHEGRKEGKKRRRKAGMLEGTVGHAFKVYRCENKGH
jgi:hypothetical protein